MSPFASWLAAPPPDAAVEIAPGRVSAATMTVRGAGRALRSYAFETLPDGVVTASLAAGNIGDRAAVAAALRAATARLSARPARIALIVPDLVARVSVIRFDHVPSRRDDLEQLIRWQVRKSAPFPIEDACVTFTTGRRDAAGGREFIVIAARRDIVQEYENACADAGMHAGIVDIATFSIVNLVLAAASPANEDWLVVHMRPEYTSIAILRDGDLIFFRNRPEGAEESLTDVVHQTAMYYQDRLAGQRFARVLLGGYGRAAGTMEHARLSLEERLAVRVEPIDWTAVAAAPEGARLVPDTIEIVAPLAGMLVRTHGEAVLG